MEKLAWQLHPYPLDATTGGPQMTALVIPAFFALGILVGFILTTIFTVENKLTRVSPKLRKEIEEMTPAKNGEFDFQ